jgi:2-methylisocitrate lyase-like PEP mutase family enzyme
MSFSDLHQRSTPLLLPNAWDVPSCLAFLDAGFEAVGTTSFGIASSHGHPDGGRSTAAANRQLAAELSSLPCYVSMDIEDGYDDDSETVARYVARLNVAGINIEDSSAGRLVAPATHAAKVAAIKTRCPDLFVNARVDTYWLDQDASVASTLERAEAYVSAGADGIFIPGATEPAVIREFTSAITVPVNLLMIPGMSLTELVDLGVRRVSTGSLPYRAAIYAAVEVANALRSDRKSPPAVPYTDLQSRLEDYDRTAG